MKAVLKAIEYYLPGRLLSNEDLAKEFPEWTAERIEKKLGIQERRIAGADETSADLGVSAAEKLFESGACKAEDIDYVLFCTQSPDYFLPSTACVIQNRLGIPTGSGAFDFNLGCSGFIYGMGLAKGLIETGQCRNVLLITSETYSKYMHPEDKSVRTVFGDAGAATLISVENDDERPGGIGPFEYGTDGSGAGSLIVCAGGMREREGKDSVTPKHVFSDEYLFMDGGSIFNFAARVVPESMNAVLTKAGLTQEQVDLFVFHQANKFMLEHLRLKCGIPHEKFYTHMSNVGNTVSATIPIALKHALIENKLKAGDRVLLAGFGVGLSWASGIIEWA